MDFLLNHTYQFQRLFHVALPVRSIGYVPKKSSWVDQTFESLNFSFILQGGGSYCINDMAFRIQAPCVIIQWPGLPVTYGPADPYDTWEEMFFIYSGESTDHWLKSGLASPEKPTWEIHRPERIQELISTLKGLLGSMYMPGLADRIDQLCETLILESKLEGKREVKTREQDIVEAVCHYIDMHFENSLNVDDIARKHNISNSTFRRYWHRSMPESPTRYLTRRRIQEAKRLLAETHRPIGEIAQAVGYDDPMYFSRRFRQEANMSASRYRRLYQIPLDQLT
jgi:AraC-like DNA-binding protein